jgi:hypothetical protein
MVDLQKRSHKYLQKNAYMANYSAIKATVNAYIKANGKKEITGHILNSVLNATIDSLGRYFQFAGGALPTDDPGTPDQNVCYLAGEPGVYTNFGGITIENEEVALLFWNGEWTKQRILIGIQEVEVSVDNQVGTPSVDVSYSGGQLVLTFHNLKGETGDAAGFGTIGADINGGVGTPGVSVESSGDNTAKNLMFHFTNLKGETGVTSVVATIDDTSGTPSCQVSLVNGVLTLAFSGLKGLKGDTGVSADYPITIYNGLDSDATDQALAAAQGKVLDGKISQLGQKIITEVTRKNLFDDSLFRSKTGITYQNGVFRGKQSAFTGSFPVSRLVAGNRYIFQFEARIVEQQTTTGTGLYFRFDYSNQTNVLPEYSGNANDSLVKNSDTGWKVYSGVTSVEELVGIRFSYSSGGNNVIEIRNIMLSEGYSIKTFVPYESLVDGVAREEISDGLLNIILSLSQKRTIDNCKVIVGPYIRYSDGVQVSSGSYNVYSFDNSEFMAKYVRVKVADRSTSNASIAFYDINDNYLQAESVQSANNPAREIIVEVPSTAIKINICNRKVLLETPEIEFYSLADSSSSGVQSETLHEINKYFVDMSPDKIFSLTDTSLIKSDGSSRTHSGYRCSDYIQVFEGDTFDYSLWWENQNVAGLCFYSETKGFVSAPVIHNPGDSSRKEGTWTAPSAGFSRV